MGYVREKELCNAKMIYWHEYIDMKDIGEYNYEILAFLFHFNAIRLMYN